MDYGKILTHSFEVVRRHRALWLFGILLALFGNEYWNQRVKIDF